MSQTTNHMSLVIFSLNHVSGLPLSQSCPRSVSLSVVSQVIMSQPMSQPIKPRVYLSLTNVSISLSLNNIADLCHSQSCLRSFFLSLMSWVSLPRINISGNHVSDYDAPGLCLSLNHVSVSLSLNHVSGLSLSQSSLRSLSQ